MEEVRKELHGIFLKLGRNYFCSHKHTFMPESVNLSKDGAHFLAIEFARYALFKTPDDATDDEKIDRLYESYVKAYIKIRGKHTES
jgi:hypothetical protein